MSKSQKKRLGWACLAAAVALLVTGETIPSAMSLIATFGAMLVGGVGIYLAFDDTPGA